jgi:16S rRNA G966 N2-methylase RsmD
MPRRKKCNSLKCKVTNFIQERRRLKKLEWDAYKKEKEKKRKEAERIKKRENAKKAAARGRAKAVKKFDIKPTVIKTQPVKPINMNPPKPKSIIKKEMVKEIPAQPIMKPNAYVIVNTVKSAGVNKYPVTWKSASSAKYSRLWFSSLNEAEQFAATKSREMRVNVSRVNAELTGR